jgi:multidrug efflux system membrane fusion protein
MRFSPFLLALSLVAPAALAQPAPPATPVTTEPVRREDVPVVVRANGLVVSESVVTIRPRVDGQIERVHVAEGQMVRRGQPLFTLDSRQNQAILAQQEAQLAALRAQAQRAALDAQRYQSLRGESYASQQRFEQAQSDAAVSAATVRATEALIAQTRLSLGFATIEAEADGRLGALPLRAGTFVRQAEATALGTITQMDPILVQFSVPERWLPALREATARGRVPVTAAPQGDAPERGGEVVFLDSAVDAATGTIAVRARFANAEGHLWPGQYVGVTMVPRVEEGALTIPTAALQTGQGGRFVFVAEQGVARRRAVQLARTVQDRAVVRGELRAGELVIVDGAQRVADGARVQDRSAPRPAPEPAAGARVSRAN